METHIEQAEGYTRVEVSFEHPYFDVYSMQFNFTSEGLIIDIFDMNGEIVETSSETYQEIIERLLGL